MSEIQFEIIQHIGMLSESSRGWRQGRSAERPYITDGCPEKTGGDIRPYEKFDPYATV
jgi:hypothetical protein